MANVIINDTNLTNIANAIREKNGTNNTYKPAEMAAAIQAITTGGGEGGSTHFRTPEEIYAEERPLDWPILPEPTQNNEIYYLCRTPAGTMNALDPYYATTTKVEYGYIDDDGAFVSVYSQERDKSLSNYWGYLGMSAQWNSKMDKYHVIRTIGSDTTFENVTSSSSANQSYMKYVLEIKARISNPKFNGNRSYSNGFYNCHFIKLYGPQDWTIGKAKFQNYKRLKCILFDSEENNAFNRTNTSITEATYMFRDCEDLLYAYPITNKWSALTTLIQAFQYCRTLPSVTIENDTVTLATGVINYCYLLDTATIKLPNWKASNTESNIYVRKYTDLDLGSWGATANNQFYFGYWCEEINNLKLGCPYANFGNANTGIGAYNGNYLRRIVMAPDQVGTQMPTTWKLYLKYSSYKDIKDFLESLPSGLSSSQSYNYTILNNWLAVDMPEELAKIATDKGYILAAAEG